MIAVIAAELLHSAVSMPKVNSPPCCPLQSSELVGDDREDFRRRESAERLNRSSTSAW